MNQHIELHAIVRGEVQGVGFRATARHFATSLGVMGTVRNCTDGSVEIFAQGQKETLEVLLNNLRRHFEIQSIEVSYSNPIRAYSGFFIIAT